MHDATHLDAILFDVFGTVVDWRSGIIRVGNELDEDVDWGAFADAWREAYEPSMAPVREGDHPWRTLDALHRASLDDLIEQFDLGDVDRDALVGAWHRLDPWPDAIPGLGRLRTKVVIAPLSNGHVRLLTNMAKRAGLPWDLVLSAQLAGTYKPDAAVYRTAVDLLDCPAEDVMMVAAHPRDLDAAADVGLRTAYVHRPNEWGPEGPSERPPTDAYDLAVDGFGALADELGVPSRLD